MYQSFTKEEREALRAGAQWIKNPEKLWDDLEAVEKQSKYTPHSIGSYPAHAEPLRTASGVRFGW